jgi:hypothetical protein
MVAIRLLEFLRIARFSVRIHGTIIVVEAMLPGEAMRHIHNPLVEVEKSDAGWHWPQAPSSQKTQQTARAVVISDEDNMSIG